MFNSIVKSVLNEITATDAYAKYYSDLPKEEFFGLTNMYGKFDNLMKMIMNDIKSGDATFDMATRFIEKYMQAPNNVRAEFSRRFQSGTIDCLEMADIEIDMISGLGATSEKDLYNMGLVVLYDDDLYKITCTTNYASNSHFFGGTSWCTASDRAGRYDGWEMFLAYTYDLEGHSVDEDDFYDFFNPDNVKACLMQCQDKKNHETYQMQIYEYGDLGQVCDSEDENISSFPLKLENNEIITYVTLSNLEKCIELTAKNVAIEMKYIQCSDNYDKRKRKIREKKFKKILDKAYRKANLFNYNKGKFVLLKFNEVLNSNLLNDYNFIEEIINASREFFNNYLHSANSIKEYDEFLSKHGFLSVGLCQYRCENFSIYELEPKLGLYHTVTEDIHNLTTYTNEKFYDSHGFCVNNNYDYTEKPAKADFSIYVILDEENRKVLKVIKAPDVNREGKKEIFLGNRYKQLKNFIILFAEDRYLLINAFNGAELELPHCVFNPKFNDNGNFTSFLQGNFLLMGNFPYSGVPNWCIVDLNTNKIIGIFRASYVFQNAGIALFNNEYVFYFDNGGKFFNLNFSLSFNVSIDEDTTFACSGRLDTDDAKDKVSKICFYNGSERLLDIFDMSTKQVIEHGAKLLDRTFNNLGNIVIKYETKDGSTHEFIWC